jgi:curved DNA-binding protein CbpA
MNYYDVLGLSQDATPHQIKAAYRRLVKVYHPDVNPAPMASEKMQEINTAYEVLADYHARNLYDLQLKGVHVLTKKESPYEKYRREYRHRRTVQDRQHMENLFRWKLRFYKYQRRACYVFFLLGLLFTIDYWVFQAPVRETILSAGGQPSKLGNIRTAQGNFITAGELGFLCKTKKIKEIEIQYSSIFSIPTRLRVPGSPENYRVYRTLHSFRNVFSIIILIFSGMVIANKEYNDFRLTSGLVPVLLILFLILFLLSEG